MTSNANPVVLITGCSSGIGRAAAEAFLAAGWITVATARDVTTLEELRARGAQVSTLDVTSDEDRRRVVGELLTRHGRLDVLVNNAGYPEYGPLEEIGLDRWRRQFETNVFSIVALTQLAVPIMRQQKKGRIINVSSMGGVITLPLGAAYHASKWAVEALSDVARFELRSFGIEVVVIQPGVVLTNFEAPAQKGLALDADSPYADLATKFSILLAGNYRAKSKNNLTPAAIGAVIVKAATVRRPRTRYSLPLQAKMLIRARKFMPDRLFDAAIRWQVR